MAKILPHSLSSNKRKELLKGFYDFVATLDREETEEFFRNFLTDSEKIIFGRRLKVARMLLQGFTSSQIRKKLGIGVSTFQFVQNWIKDELAERRVKQKLPLK